MRKKGISPLIATVLLIALTMAIAGVMSTWATVFVKNQIEKAEQASANQTTITCSGSIAVNALVMAGKGYAIVTVDATPIPLSDWTGYVFYDDPSKNEDAQIANASVSLTTGQVHTFNFTNSSAFPRRLKLTAGNCPLASRTVDISLS